MLVQEKNKNAKMILWGVEGGWGIFPPSWKVESVVKKALNLLRYKCQLINEKDAY